MSCDHHPKTSCCGTQEHNGKKKKDLLLWGSGAIIAVFYMLHWLLPDLVSTLAPLKIFSQSVFELMNTMWVGLFLGIVMIGLLSKIPREFVISILGNGGGLNGILRATASGVLLDLCNHGILMVASKLYERGASIGQVIAFLIASPWNSFSLTLILIALIGLPWTLAFIAFSVVIAVVTGLIFERLTANGTLPPNPHTVDLPHDFHFITEAKKGLKATKFNGALLSEMAVNGLRDSRMVIRWIFFGVVLAGLIRAFVNPEIFGTYFGPTLLGLGLTLVAATIIEVCSEGSTPIAADLLTRAGAPGNSFAFLMAGAATDYTEIMVLKETTKTWRIPLLLPVITVPQVIIIAYVINTTVL